MHLNFNPFVQKNTKNISINNNSNLLQIDDEKNIKVNKPENGEIINLFNEIPVLRKRKMTKTKFTINNK